MLYSNKDPSGISASSSSLSASSSSRSLSSAKVCALFLVVAGSLVGSPVAGEGSGDDAVLLLLSPAGRAVSRSREGETYCRWSSCLR